MGEISTERMIELMQMEDTAPVGMVVLDRFEWRDASGADTLVLDGQAWYGNDYDKVWMEAEGERHGGEQAASVELLWDRIFSRWWSLQAGVRHDFNEGPARTWAAFGVQGLAPYWFEIEATMYVGEQSRTAASVSAEIDLLLTQRLILQPQAEIELYGKDDPGNGLGSGLAQAELGLRLRYEIRREIAPYVGLAWTRRFGATADLARAEGGDASELQLLAGLRVWF